MGGAQWKRAARLACCTTHRMLAAILRASPRLQTRSFTTAMTTSGPISILGTSRLQGLNVLITGASGGIGKSTALLFARTGANVVLCARRKDALDSAVQDCSEAYKAQGSVAGERGGKFAAIVMDMRDRKSIDNIVHTLPDWASKIDVLVANAGLVRGKDKIGDIDPDEIDEMLECNVRGFIHLNQIFVRRFREQNSGHLITLGSIAGREAYPGGAIYCSTKFAVHAFTSSLLKELVDTPIRVTEIQVSRNRVPIWTDTSDRCFSFAQPGMVETDFSVTRYRGDKAKADAVSDQVCQRQTGRCLTTFLGVQGPHTLDARRRRRGHHLCCFQTIPRQCRRDTPLSRQSGISVPRLSRKQMMMMVVCHWQLYSTIVHLPSLGSIRLVLLVNLSFLLFGV